VVARELRKTVAYPPAQSRISYENTAGCSGLCSVSFQKLPHLLHIPEQSAPALGRPKDHLR